MATIIKKTSKEIVRLTELMTAAGLSFDSRFPTQKRYPSQSKGKNATITEISVGEFENRSSVLKINSYINIYEKIVENKFYNMLLPDDAAVLFRYRFSGVNLIKHSLAYFPSPDLSEYHLNSELYSDDVNFSECIRKEIVPTPVRFDFDLNAFQNKIHPASHFTIGQFKNCRIPVSAPLTPHRFITFILKSFYNTAYHRHCENWKSKVPEFHPTISDQERLEFHMNFGSSG